MVCTQSAEPANNEFKKFDKINLNDNILQMEERNSLAHLAAVWIVELRLSLPDQWIGDEPEPPKASGFGSYVWTKVYYERTKHIQARKLTTVNDN